MKKAVALCLGCLLSSAAFATGETGTPNYIDQSATIERFRELERMDVTSEREPADPKDVEAISPELENILERAFTLCEDDCIEQTDLQLSDVEPVSTDSEADEPPRAVERGLGRLQLGLRERDLDGCGDVLPRAS